MCDRVQPIADTASRDHGGDKGEVLLVYLLVNNNRIVYLQLVLGIYTLPGRWPRRISKGQGHATDRQTNMQMQMQKQKQTDRHAQAVRVHVCTGIAVIMSYIHACM